MFVVPSRQKESHEIPHDDVARHNVTTMNQCVFPPPFLVSVDGRVSQVKAPAWLNEARDLAVREP